MSFVCTFPLFINFFFFDSVRTHARINGKNGVILWFRGNWILPCVSSTSIGTYETGIASYKHMYFNATRNTLKIWILTVTAIILLYESIKYLVRLMTLRMVRWSMVLLFCLSVFSHYYAWWACVNYYNDDFYSQWNHQLFFTVC